MCRWPLGRLDRVEFSDLLVTHEWIAGRLGARRESVTAAAVKLQRAGLIRYRRGHISVIDRSGLDIAPGVCTVPHVGNRSPCQHEYVLEE